MGHTPIVETMTMREALLGVLNEDMAELFSRVVALEMGRFSSLVIATEEEAIAGVDNTKAMTPLRTHQAIAANPSGYLRPADHTKAIHDSLRIDADTLGGHHASELLAFAGHTKALHDPLRIDADTLDGYHSTGLRAKNDSIYLSQGQVIHFSETVGDKIRLHGTQYGIAVNTDELTLYAPSGSEIAVRDSAHDGQKLGDLIHTGNMADREVAMTLSRLVSTPGNHIIRSFRSASYYTIDDNDYYCALLTFTVPWLGVTTYSFSIFTYASEGSYVYFKFNDTEYGPYFVQSSAPTWITIDCAETGTVDITAKAVSNYGEAGLNGIKVQTGNAEILYRVGVLYVHENLKTY